MRLSPRHAHGGPRGVATVPALEGVPAAVLDIDVEEAVLAGKAERGVEAGSRSGPPPGADRLHRRGDDPRDGCAVRPDVGEPSIAEQCPCAGGRGDVARPSRRRHRFDHVYPAGNAGDRLPIAVHEAVKDPRGAQRIGVAVTGEDLCDIRSAAHRGGSPSPAAAEDSTRGEDGGEHCGGCDDLSGGSRDLVGAGFPVRGLGQTSDGHCCCENTRRVGRSGDRRRSRRCEEGNSFRKGHGDRLVRPRSPARAQDSYVNRPALAHRDGAVPRDRDHGLIRRRRRRRHRDSSCDDWNRPRHALNNGTPGYFTVMILDQTLLQKGEGQVIMGPCFMGISIAGERMRILPGVPLQDRRGGAA